MDGWLGQSRQGPIMVHIALVSLCHQACRHHHCQHERFWQLIAAQVQLGMCSGLQGRSLLVLAAVSCLSAAAAELIGRHHCCVHSALWVTAVRACSVSSHPSLQPIRPPPPRPLSPFYSGREKASKMSFYEKLAVVLPFLGWIRGYKIKEWLMVSTSAGAC